MVHSGSQIRQSISSKEAFSSVKQIWRYYNTPDVGRGRLSSSLHQKHFKRHVGFLIGIYNVQN